MKKILKHIVVGFVLLFSSSIFLSSFVFAETQNNLQTNQQVESKSQKEQTDEKDIAQTLNTFQTLGQGLYAITWPLIMIAGKFMSNDVIYGSFIGMDTLLWKIWNVMRTFANYIIGIILIFSIFTLFLGGKFERFNPIKIIPQLVVSALLVNASWFILGACLDLSSILTYSVGMMPLKVTEDQLNLNKTPIPTFAIKFQNDKKAIQVGVKDGDSKEIIPFCELTSLTGGGIKIYAPKNAKNGCAYHYGTGYYLVPAGDGIKVQDGGKIDVSGLQVIKTKTFGQLMMKNPGMSTVLGTLYASILNVGRLTGVNSGSTVGMGFDLLFKFIFFLALLVPLFTFALIMIARAVVLWMFIIISPIVFLFTSIKGIGDKLLGEKGTFKSMCCMVFLPVIATFALSIAFVFLSVLDFNTMKANFGIDGKGNEIYIQTDGNPEHRITIKYKDTGNDSALTSFVGAFKDSMLWIIKLMFAIGFMWILVFTALKSCKVTSGIAVFIGGFAKSFAKATPIIPFAGGQSIRSLGQGLNTLAQLPGQKQMEQRERLEAMFGEALNSGKESENIKKISNNIVNSQQEAQNTVSNVISHPISYTEANGNTKQLDLRRTTYNDLLNNDKALSAVASQLGIQKDALKRIIQAQPNKNNKFSSDTSAIEKLILEEKVRKLLNDALSANLTINQLSQEAKNMIYKVFQNSSKVRTKPAEDDIKAHNQKLAQALKEFGFSNDNIKKLIAKNLIQNKIADNEKDIIKNIINNLR